MNIALDASLTAKAITKAYPKESGKTMKQFQKVKPIKVKKLSNRANNVAEKIIRMCGLQDQIKAIEND